MKWIVLAASLVSLICLCGFILFSTIRRKHKHQRSNEWLG